jgi:hypothetical protein
VWRSRLVRLAALGAGALIVAAIATWPVAAHLGTHAVDPGSGGAAGLWSQRADVYLTIRLLAWGVHAATTRAPLLDANVFHPAPGTLALSENLLGAQPLYLPLALATGDPVLAHQATLVLTFAAAFLAMAALVRDWTGAWPAAVAAGTLFATCGLRMGQMAALHLEGNWYLPLVVLLVRRAALRPGLSAPALLAATLVLVTLHSYYLGYAAFGAAGLVALMAIAGEPQARRRWPALSAAIGAAAACVAIASLPYVAAARAGALVPPTPDLLALGSARPGRTGATVVLAIAVFTAPWWRRGLRPGVGGTWPAALVLLAVVGHALALGPVVHLGPWQLPGPFALLARIVPGLGAFRAPGRLDVLPALGLAALAGIGMAGVGRVLADRLRAVPLAAEWAVAALVATAALAVAARGVPLRPIVTRATLPPVYRWLATAERGAVLELPFHDVERYPLEREIEAERAYLSVYHWQPLLNGYSGYVPPSYRPVSALVRALPDPRALELLRRTTGLRWVVVHPELPPAARAAWRGPAVGDATVVDLGVTEPDLESALLDRAPRATSILGTPLAPLPPEGRIARLAFATPPPAAAYAGIAFPLRLRVENASTVSWPALATPAAGLVRLAARWEDDTGTPVGEPWYDRLPYDLAPGDAVVVELAAVPPLRDGRHRLVVGLAQDGAWFPDTLVAAVSIERPLGGR